MRKANFCLHEIGSFRCLVLVFGMNSQRAGETHKVEILKTAVADATKQIDGPLPFGLVQRWTHQPIECVSDQGKKKANRRKTSYNNRTLSFA